ncbi:MAG TPA: SUMF1/EgtB/PvdO family nonheme iron enzyme [Halanaerobiales bacterium]|nr:SUMF1/EgtB/PvdO family nonheme iron enzyme [Halanaerobiales bacterium]
MLKIIKEQSKLVLFLSSVLLVGLILSGCDSGSLLNDEYTLTINVEGEGTVDPAAGKHDFEEGTLIVLEITPDKDYKFKEWSGDNSDEVVYDKKDDKYNLLMNSDKEIIAVFTDIGNTDFKIITAIEELEEITVEYGTLFKDLNLPETVEVTLDDDSKENISVTWSEDDYNSKKVQKQSITGELTDLPNNITNPYNLTVSANVVQEDNTSPVDVNPEMVAVPAGTAANGTTSISYNIEVGKYEVTHAEYIVFLNNAGVASDGSYEGEEVIDMDDNACAIGYSGNFYFEGNNYAESEDNPLIEVTWYGAVAYCNWLSEQEGLTPAYNLSNWELTDDPQNLEGYRLATEIEWEYTARGGKDGSPTIYSGSDNVDEVAWYEDNSGDKTHIVGEKEANELGIFDMSGNVFEWTNTLDGSKRVYRGGSWYYNAYNCRVSRTVSNSPYYSSTSIGFRLTKTN